MRITQNMMTRNYLKSLNRGMSNLAASGQRMQSGRRFEHGSDNISDAMRALDVRNKLSHTEEQLTNVRDAQGELGSAESNLNAINNILQTVMEKTNKALSDTNGDQRSIIASEISKLKGQILQFANAQYADKFLFSGSNNAEPPFRENADGEVLYNGIKVADIFKNADGKYSYMDANGIETPVPQDEDVYIDVGMGMSMGGTSVDPRTAYKSSFSGLDLMGAGKNADGLPNNLLELLGDVATAFSNDPVGSYDGDLARKLSGQLKSRANALVLNITDIGTRSNFLEKATERLENDFDSMTTLGNKLEYIDDAEESMNLKMFQYTWLATLQFGSKVIPQSLMDFL